ncbi:MAG: hypothetical protein P9X24_04615 [Candidatus Hatepunaea meridiana]|nr:hypothetical protein [Candidatus Hatepunaea meridiana]
MAITVDPNTRGIRIYTVSLTTDGTEAASATLDVYGDVVGVWLDKGDLSTPDVDISDTLTGELVVTVNGVVGDTMWHTKVLATSNAAGALTNTGNIYENYYVQNMTVAVSGAGDAKTGVFYIYVKNR